MIYSLIPYTASLVPAGRPVDKKKLDSFLVPAERPVNMTQTNRSAGARGAYRLEGYQQVVPLGLKSIK